MIDRALGVVLAAALATAIVWGSNVPLALNGSDDAVLRLAWGVRPERIETCRDLSPDELSNLPQHMRQERVCEGVTAEYRLVVDGEDGARVNRVVRGGGLRQDRRLYVFEELPVPAGPAAFDVRFERITHPADAEESASGEVDENDGDPRERREEIARRGAVPAVLSLALRVTARPREVILVTYDPQRRELVAITGRNGS